MRACVFGALSLLLLFLLGLSCPAYAGHWESPTYVWSGSAHLQHLYYHPVANNLYNIDLTRTKNVLRGGVPVGPPANPNSPTRSDYGPPNQALVTWNNTGTAFAGDDNTHSGPVAPPAASSDANSSVFAVFHWQRQQINGHDDATDNPPQYVYMSERATLYAQRYTFAAGGSLTAYADTPWPADFVSVTGHAGSRDLQVNLNNANWQYDRQGFDTGTAYQYTLQASGTAVHRYAVQGDTVSLASVRFEGAVSLAPGYARPQDSARGLGAITCYYAAAPVTFSLLARLKAVHEVTNLVDDYSSSATIAAGHLSNGQHIHEADLALQIVGPDNTPVANAEIPRLSKLTVDHPGGVEKSATLQGIVSSGTTDANGRIYLGSLLSRDLTSSVNDTVTVHLKDAPEVKATIAEGWASIDWKMGANGEKPWDPWFFAFDSDHTEGVVAKAQFAEQIPLTKHTMKFLVKRLVVDQTGVNGSVTHTIYTTDKTEADNAGPDSGVVYNKSINASSYLSFSPESVQDQGNGTYKTQMTIKHSQAWQITDLTLGLEDQGVYEH
ncbi:hypothetical protein IAD21_03791 [Abditibacteriota bacterium]|nr:hypothetical protein IAD21_03791 [Abditibacteriota bacterium]